jgi:hypothetical protein
MSAKTPEGKLKERCRKLARDKLKLFWANVEGKAFNGFPDTEVGKFPAGSGIIHIEFKREGLKPTEQQLRRIDEINAAGGEAGWTDTFEGFCKLIGYDLDL